MKLSEVCIKRPVLAWVMTLVLVVVGIVGGKRLPLQQYPKFERPFITVETTLPGASPEIVETQVTKVVEEALSGIEGIETITSTSQTEESKVQVEFKPDRPIDAATNDIRDRLAKFRDKLPDEATEPVLTKSRAEEKPIITLALTSESIEPSDLADLAMRELEKDIESLPGVARVDTLGSGEFKMKIFLNPLKLASYNITVREVIDAIKRQSIEKPAGKLVSKDREYLVTTVASMETPEEFNNLVVAHREHHLIRIKDIGRTEVTAEDKRTKTYYNGRRGISIGIIKQSQANPIDVARSVKGIIDKLQVRLPGDTKIHIGSDKTVFIERSIQKVYSAILEATILVVLVVFVFLRSIKAALVPLVTIPVSLIGVMFLMYILGFSINTLTLMAMVLSIGLVVDDAIVVLENVYRYIEKGYSPFKAAFMGIKEISFAVIAMTFTLVAVYLPVSFAKGMTGKLLTEFSITLAGAVLLSGFAALTLSPMMCARLIRHGHGSAEDKSASISAWQVFKERYFSDRWLITIENFYAETLKKALENRLWIVISAFIFCSMGLMTYFNLPDELMPTEDQSSISVEGSSPQSATLAYTDRFVSHIDAIIRQVPEVEKVVSQINNPTYETNVQIKADSKRSTEEIAKDLESKVSKVTGVTSNVESSSTGISDEKKAVEFALIGNKSYSEFKILQRPFVQALYARGISNGVRTEIRQDIADYIVSLVRDKISALNIDPMTVAEMIEALIRGKKANWFKKNNKTYEVRVEIESEAKTSPKDINNLFIKAGDKEESLVPLSELIDVQPRSGPVEIHHYGRQRSVGFTAYLKPGVGIGEAVTRVTEMSKELLPNDVRVEFTYGTKRFLNESYTLILVMVLAIIFIYLVMAAQFESWRDPFIIILSVPLSLSGALITLTLVKNGSLNIYSKIGLITLIGLITKHGILMVDFANKMRDEQDKNIFDAIYESCRLRLRPILMTTFAMVLGALPLALAAGAGSESRRQIGWVIVGGMSVGTLFTLFVVPVVYTIMARRKPVVPVTIDD